MGTQKVTENIYANVDYDGGNVVCIRTNERIILVDTPTLPGDINDWKDFVYGLDPRGPEYIINTHIHFDHLMGNKSMGGKVVMHQSGAERLFKKGSTLRETIGGLKDLWSEDDIDFMLKEPLVRPSITMSEAVNIYLGEYTLKLTHVGGHTPDSLIVYTPEDKVLITGDNLTAGHHPYRGEASFLDWIQALVLMKSYDIEYIVPGHGYVCGREEIDRFIEYFEKQYNLAKDLVERGFSRQEIVDRVRDEIFGFFQVEPERIKGAMMMFDMGTKQLYREIQTSLRTE